MLQQTDFTTEGMKAELHRKAGKACGEDRGAEVTSGSKHVLTFYHKSGF